MADTPYPGPPDSQLFNCDQLHERVYLLDWVLKQKPEFRGKESVVRAAIERCCKTHQGQRPTHGTMRKCVLSSL